MVKEPYVPQAMLALFLIIIQKAPNWVWRVKPWSWPTRWRDTQMAELFWLKDGGSGRRWGPALSVQPLWWLGRYLLSSSPNLERAKPKLQLFPAILADTTFSMYQLLISELLWVGECSSVWSCTHFSSNLFQKSSKLYLSFNYFALSATLPYHLRVDPRGRSGVGLGKSAFSADC